MATISKRRKKDGSFSYTAQIRITKRGADYTESRTFSREALASDWAKRREVELEHPGALEKAAIGAISLGKLIADYIEQFERTNKWQRSKGQHLRLLGKMDIAKVDAVQLTAQHLIDHVRLRRRGSAERKAAGPATVMNDLVWIGAVMRAAKGIWGLPVDPLVVDQARVACRELRLVAKGRKRDVRPTPAQLQQLTQLFERRDGRASIPMRDVMWFAVYSARRQAEITRLEWRDLDAEALTLLVRDVKHPTHKIGNHRLSKLTPEALAIIQRQPRTEGELLIFPYNEKSISSNFARACGLVGIEDLTFHDLRHEATSRLFERGYQIHEVAQFTLHESWQELKRYTQIKPGLVRNLPENAANSSPPLPSADRDTSPARRR